MMECWDFPQGSNTSTWKTSDEIESGPRASLRANSSMSQNWRELEPEVMQRLKAAHPYDQNYDCGQMSTAWYQVLTEHGIPAQMKLGHPPDADDDHVWLVVNGETFDPAAHTNPGVDLNDPEQSYDVTPPSEAWLDPSVYRRATIHVANILDDIHDTLPVRIWEHPGAPEPQLRPGVSEFIHHTIYSALERNGYKNPHEWLNLVITGSLTTYQYGEQSDCDVSLFVNSQHLPEWSRAEMIGIMVGECDGQRVPGTPYPLQCFVVARRLSKGDLYRPGLRSGYDIDQNRWIVPPDPNRSHNVEQLENGFYTYALESADKMDRLLKYEPDKARQYFEAIRRRRREDQSLGKGDFSESNVVYKFLEKRGLTPKLEELSPSWLPHAQFRSKSRAGTHPRAGERHAGDKRASWSVVSAVHDIIHHTEARGNSRPVSFDEFQRLAEEGKQRYYGMRSNLLGTEGLDRDWEGMKRRLYHEVLKPWGGATINPQTGEDVPQGSDHYALTVRPPGTPTISIPENPSPQDFHAAMDAARSAYGDLLPYEGHHLGVFHDDDLKRIDIDPTIVVDNPHDVETIGSYTRNVGGAYHFATGDGYFPPHVAPGQENPGAWSQPPPAA